MPVKTPLRHVIPISGKDSLCTAVVQNARDDSVDYEYLFCDVGMELPETYAWLAKVESYLGYRIEKVGANLEDLIRSNGILPSHHRRFCTRLGKIIPLMEYLAGDQAVQYVGIRADEDRPLNANVGLNIQVRYPLVELGITLPMVFKILSDRKVMPPDFFWGRLFDAVWKLARGITVRKFIDNLEPWNRSALFAGRSRSNCFNCFYQRRYEWVWLLEAHPELFARAESLEKQVGVVSARDPEEERVQFYWMKGCPLSRIRTRAESIFVKHARQTYARARDACFRGQYRRSLSLIETTSCGTFCGK